MINYIKLNILTIGIMLIMSCFTCKRQIDQKWIGNYENYDTKSGELIQFYFVPGSPFIYHKCIVGDSVEFFSDTVIAADFKRDCILFKFKNHELRAKPIKRGGLQLLLDKPQLLEKISCTNDKMNGKWQLEKINGQMILSDIPVIINININTEKLGGYLGCNRGAGTLKVIGQMGFVENLITTRMACLNSNIEQKVIQTIERFVIVKISDEKLIVSGKYQLEFSRL